MSVVRTIFDMDHLALLHTDGVFLRREAIEHGYDDADLRAAVRAGILARVRHGAYTSARRWTTADDLVRHQLRAHAVLRSHRSSIALSHTTAAVFHGLRLFEPDLRRVHVTCLNRRLARTTDDIVYHHGSVEVTNLVEVQRALVVDPVRAAIEAASVGSIPQGVVVLDSVLDLAAAELNDLWHCYEERTGWPNSRRLQVSLRLARPGSNSVGESLARHLMWRTHLPEPVLQFEVRGAHGELIGRTDFAWPEYGVLGEFDGIAKYGRLLRPGESSQDAMVREKLREDRLREATGWLMIRLVWSDLATQSATAARIRTQLDRGRVLIGQRHSA
jgi:hypothetical protein